MTTVAQTILEQLGGNRFIAMTGARDFVDFGQGVRFKLPRGARQGINLVSVKLEGNDTYTVLFQRYRGLQIATVHTVEGVYNDALRRTFTTRTGLDCTL